MEVGIVKALIAILLLLIAALFLIRHQIGQPIDCGIPGQATPESRKEQATQKETVWHKLLLTRSECRRVSAEEVRQHLINNSRRTH